jgi:hypothetical protein
MLIVDPWHWLEPNGAIPTENLRMRTKLLAVLRVIEYGSSLRQGASCETLIECWKRPGGRRCLGLLQVARAEDDSLFAYCPECGTEHLLVSNWQKTRWAAQKSHWVT